MSGVRFRSGTTVTRKVTARGALRFAAVASAVWAVSALPGCGGGGEVADVSVVVDCGAKCAQDFLSAADVEKILAQTVVAAQARGQRATVAVTDRVGNVLGVSLRVWPVVVVLRPLSLSMHEGEAFDNAGSGGGGGGGSGGGEQ